MGRACISMSQLVRDILVFFIGLSFGVTLMLALQLLRETRNSRAPIRR